MSESDTDLRILHDKIRRLERRIDELESRQVGNKQVRMCAHDACAMCHGSGRKADGSYCIHGIVCSCPKHSAY